MYFMASHYHLHQYLFFQKHAKQVSASGSLYFPFPSWECSCPHIFYGLFLFIFKVSVNNDVLRTQYPSQSFFIALSVQDNLAYFYLLIVYLN